LIVAGVGVAEGDGESVGDALADGEALCDGVGELDPNKPDGAGDFATAVAGRASAVASVTTATGKSREAWRM
jgi:hypothetical protein